MREVIGKGTTHVGILMREWMGRWVIDDGCLVLYTVCMLRKFLGEDVSSVVPESIVV